MSTQHYRDPNASVEKRVENLLVLMTLDEKLAQLGCLWSTAFVSTGSFDPNIVAEQMPHGIGQVTRIGASTGLHPQESAAFRRVLRLKFQLGLFEHPYVDAEVANAAFQTPEQRALARQTVAESTILLTNDGVLPLAPTVKRVAVIGPGADDERLLQGDYHYPAHLELIYAAPPRVEAEGLLPSQASGSYAPGPYFTPHVTPLAGLRAALANDVEVLYAKGCEVLGNDRSSFFESFYHNHL